jgi:hypothetical protein
MAWILSADYVSWRHVAKLFCNSKETTNPLSRKLTKEIINQNVGA